MKKHISAVIGLVIGVCACLQVGITKVSAQATSVLAYDCWSNLSFQAGLPGISSYSNNGTAVTFPSDPTHGHAGGGGPNVLHFDGTSYCSVWGTHNAGNFLPAAGDSVGGSFWIYLLSAPTAGSSVDVQMIGTGSSGEVVFCHTSAVDLTTLPLNTWVQVPLTPTTLNWAANLTLGFNILTNGGVNCYIDNVVFGKQVAAATPAYDCWGNLSFLAGPVNTSFYSNNGTAVTFLADPTQGHAGGGGPDVLHLDGTSYASVWGGPTTGTYTPAAGDSIGGSFWIYLLSRPTAGSYVDVQMDGYVSNTETIYCHTSSVDLTKLPLNAWVQVPLTPTNLTWAANLTLGYNVVTAGGVNCYIDNVTFAKQVPAVSPYGYWGNLSFQAGPVNISSYSGNNTAITFPADPTQGHVGGGGPNVLHLDGTAYESVWGGPATAGAQPSVGDSIGGSFWIYLLSRPATGNSVDVQMTATDSSNTQTIYCHTSPLDLTALPLNTWVQVSLTPTNSTWAANLTPGFNIVSAGGVNCYIDGITFGKQLAGGASPSTANVLPVFQEYTGTGINGNFELGNASLGNVYWGSSNSSMMNLITNPAGTAPGAAENGNNMVSIACGGFAWDVTALAATSMDWLPRVGDMVAGYYWLYVPANADLSQGFPMVSFVSIDASNTDTTIANSTSFPASSLKKGAWNQIPVYPVGPNTAVLSNAANFGIIVTAPQLNPSNPLYASPYYLDDIQVGKVPVGFNVSPSSGLTDAYGNGITQLGANDTSLFAQVNVLNSQNSAPTNALAVLSLYQQGVLKSTVTQPVTINATGTSGESITQFNMSAPLNGLDKTQLSATVTLYDSNHAIVLAAPFSLIQLTQMIAPNDSHILHIGRWTGNASSYISDYVRPYIKTSFTGPSVAINLQKSVNLDVFVDGVEAQYNGAIGLLQLASNLSPNATHTLEVAGLTYPDLIKYNALYLDEAGAMGAPVVNANEIEFIGDSITAWNNGYSWLVPQTMGVESSRICWPGIALQTGFGYVTTNPPNVGMQDAYFDIGMPTYGSGTPGLWNFSTSPYTPSIIVINLGTNDAAQITGNSTLLGNFQTAYINFIDKIRSDIPNAQIFVMRPVSIPYADVDNAIANAAQAVITAGDTKVHYIDTTSWTVQIGPDGIHPTNYGHTEITNYLVPILTPYLH